jgi:hypothetical protein
MPPHLKHRAAEIARSCGWSLRRRNGLLEIRPKEGQAYRVLTMRLLASKQNVATAGAFSFVRSWLPQDDLADKAAFEAIHRYARGQLAKGGPEKWEGVRLVIATASDEELPVTLRAVYRDEVLPHMPEALCFGLRISPYFQSRLALVRHLVSMEGLPALHDRQRTPGFLAAYGLAGNLLVGFQPYIVPALILTSPWALGLMAFRVGGLVVFVFDHPVLLRPPSRTCGLDDLYRPTTLFEVEFEASEPPPQIDAPEVERFLTWWLQRLNVLLGALSDPRFFVDQRGCFEPRRQFVTLLSIERLFSAIQGVLSDARYGYARLGQAFEVLDLLEGLGYGDYERTASPERLGGMVEELGKTLPRHVARVALPTCLRAAQAIRDVADGFAPDLRVGGGISVMPKSGGSREILSTDKVSLATK